MNDPGVKDAVVMSSTGESGRGHPLWSHAVLCLHLPTPIGVIEALVGIVALTIAGFVAPGHWGMLDIQPHPLWVVVIAIAIRYGAASGYIAGFVAAASYTLFLCVSPDLHLHAPSMQQMTQPILLLIGGIVVGELTRSQHRRLTTVQQHYQQMRESSRELMQHQRMLADENAELKRRIMTQSSSLLTLHHVAQTLNVLQVEAIYPAIRDIVSSVLEAEDCALYCRREEWLQLYIGSPQSYPPAISSATKGIMGRALREARIVTIRDRLMDEDPQAIVGDPVVMAGPLVGRDAQILGIVAVRQLPIAKLSRPSIRTFQILLDWSSAALANALEYEELQSKAMTAQSSVRDAVSSRAPMPHREQAEQDDLIPVFGNEVT